MRGNRTLPELQSGQEIILSGRTCGGIVEATEVELKSETRGNNVKPEQIIQR
jgi:hypothetical protein